MSVEPTIHVFDSNQFVQLELRAQLKAGLLEDVRPAIRDLPPAMAAAVEAVVGELDAEVSDRTIYLGDSRRGEIEIIGLDRICINPFFMQIDMRVLMPVPSGAPPREVVFRSVRWNVGIENGVAVLALTKDRRIVLVREFKHAVRDWCIHIMRGLRKPGETERDAGLREAGEEGGVSVTAESEVIDLGPLDTDTGILSARPRLLLVTNVVVDNGAVRHDPTEAFAGTIVLTIDNVKQLIRERVITDSFTRTAIFQADLEGHLR